MDTLATWFVGQPLHILLVALPFAALAWWPRKPGAAVRSNTAMAWAAGAWLAYAGWEALVQWRTPEADLRVDLLLIWPLLVLLSGWALIRWVWLSRRR